MNRPTVEEAIALNLTLSYVEPGDNGEVVTVTKTCAEVIKEGRDYHEAMVEKNLELAERLAAEYPNGYPDRELVLDFLAVHWAVINLPVAEPLRCLTCRHFGGQGVVGLQHEEGTWRYCALFLFGEFGRETTPMPEYRVTWGNANGAKGQLFVHETFGCINHNPEFDTNECQEKSKA